MVVCSKCLRKAELRLAKGERLRYFECEWCGGRPLFVSTPEVEASLREQRRGGGFGPLFARAGPRASSRAGPAEPAELRAAQPPRPAGGPTGGGAPPFDEPQQPVTVARRR